MKVMARRKPWNKASASATVAAAPLSIACLTRRCSESAEMKAVMAFPQKPMWKKAARSSRSTAAQRLPPR